MRKEKSSTAFFGALLYLSVGIISTFGSGYLIFQYFLISRNKWYIVDMSVAVLNAIGLSVTLVILLKKTSDKIKILFYRVFMALGLVGASSLMMLQFYFHMSIPRFPPKLIIATLIIDAIIIKLVYDKKIESLRT